MCRLRSTSPRLSSGKPAGAVIVRVSHDGLYAPKKKILSRSTGPPTVNPASLVCVPDVLMEPFSVWICLNSPSSAEGRA